MHQWTLYLTFQNKLRKAHTRRKRKEKCQNIEGNKSKICMKRLETNGSTKWVSEWPTQNTNKTRNCLALLLQITKLKQKAKDTKYLAAFHLKPNKTITKIQIRRWVHFAHQISKPDNLYVTDIFYYCYVASFFFFLFLSFYILVRF